MPAPRLLLSLNSTPCQKQLQQVESLGLFNITQWNDDDWITEITNNSYPVAIIELKNFSSADFDKLLTSRVLIRTDVIFISDGTPNEAIDQAMHHGASFHLKLPIDTGFLSELLAEISTEIDSHAPDTEQPLTSDLDQFGLLVGSSPVMRKLYRVIRKAADTPANIFLVGESGAGKELVANTVHLMASTAEKPFVALNCGALSHELIESELFGHVKGAFTGAHRDRQGAFEQAQGGTLFLDEVTEMPMEHQVKLLRVLETGEYKPVGSNETKIADVRVISATNREPSEAIQQEIFREDLYFRLSHFPIRIPPLRERSDDITGLAKHFLAYRNNEEKTSKEISTQALDKIQRHTWPGNVRELKHAIERAYILADDIIDAAHLIIDEGIEGASGSDAELNVPTGMPLEEVEKQVILQTLDSNEGNKTETANQLGVSVKTLYNKLEKYEE